MSSFTKPVIAFAISHLHAHRANARPITESQSSPAFYTSAHKKAKRNGPHGPYRQQCCGRASPGQRTASGCRLPLAVIFRLYLKRFYSAGFICLMQTRYILCIAYAYTFRSQIGLFDQKRAFAKKPKNHCRSSSLNASPHSGQNFGGCSASSGSQPQREHRYFTVGFGFPHSSQNLPSFT